MWKKLNTLNLFISVLNEYEIFVTDYVTIWYTYFSRASFLHCLKDSNSLLEMSDEALLQKGQQVLSNPDGLKNVQVQHDRTCLVVNMTMVFGYPFKISLKLSEGSKELFFNKITQPLLKTVLDLKNSQLELCQLLKKKDNEIEEYKCEGGEIAIKHLKTKPFNEKALLSKYVLFDEHFGTTNDLICSLIQTVLKSPEENVKKEPMEISNELLKVKVEPQSQISCSTTCFNSSMASVKAESHQQNMQIKTEINSQIRDSQSISSVNASVSIKRESETTVRTESESIPAFRKKIKKLF